MQGVTVHYTREYYIIYVFVYLEDNLVIRASDKLYNSVFFLSVFERFLKKVTRSVVLFQTCITVTDFFVNFFGLKFIR